MADQDLWRKNLPDGWQGKMADEWDGEIPLKPIYWSAAAVAIAVFVAFVFNSWLMNAWDGAQEVRESPLASDLAQFEHVTPKLQPKPEIEFTAMKEAETEHLETYGWVDPMDERVHIPVARAMEIVLDEQAPAPSTIEADSAPVDVEADAPSATPETDSETESTEPSSSEPAGSSDTADAPPSHGDG